MQKILHSKSLDFKPESPLNMKKIIISKSEKMHINLFTLYFGASHAMICSYLAKSDDQYIAITFKYVIGFVEKLTI